MVPNTPVASAAIANFALFSFFLSFHNNRDVFRYHATALVLILNEGNGLTCLKPLETFHVDA